MKYVSLFSGIEAATAAWEPLGWEPVCFAEFDEFPSAVLAERYPEVPNIGDVTKMNWRKYRGKVDLVVGGSPCQSFSIAGKREGLQGESGLMFEYIRAVREIQGAGAGGVGAEPEQSPTLTADWHNPAVYPIDEPITMADLNANTAIGYDMVGTLKVGGDAPSVCL